MGWPGPMTRWQYLAWLAWLELDLECPDRHDLYVMQLTHEVAAAPMRVWGKDLENVPLERYRLRRKDDGKAAATSPRPTQAKVPAVAHPPDGPSERHAEEGTPALPLAAPSSSQEHPPGLVPPPVVTTDNRAALEAKIAVAIKLAAAKQQMEQRKGGAPTLPGTPVPPPGPAGQPRRVPPRRLEPPQESGEDVLDG